MSAFSDMLFLPPTLGTSIHGTPLEEVMFLRDEMANMAWAVERMVENPLGRPRNRSEAFFRSRQQQVPRPRAATGDAAALPLYRLRTDVPEHWIPLLPIRLSPASPSIRLERCGTWQGHILHAGHDPEGHEVPLRLYEKEVPREGARVSRAFQYTRWTDGQTYIWVGRRKEVGGGEGSSGLRFDVLEDGG
jgi:hypothetical protein